MKDVIFAVTEITFFWDMTPYILSTSLQMRHIPEDSDLYTESV
jgi:hypothetical protein